MSTPFDHFTAMVTKKYPELIKTQKISFKKKYFPYIHRRLFEIGFGVLIICTGQNFLYAQNFELILWPSTGVGLAMLFLRGSFMLLPIVLGIMLAGYFQQWPITENLYLCGCFGLYLGAIYYLSLKLIGPIAPIYKAGILGKWISLLIVTSFIFVYFLSILMLNFKIPTYSFVIKNTFGALNGILGLTPFALMLDPFTFKQKGGFKKSFWWCFSLLAGIFYTIVVLYYPSLILSFYITLIIGGLLFSFRYGQIPTGLTLLGFSTLNIGLPLMTSYKILLPFLFTVFATACLMIATSKEASTQVMRS